MSNIVLKNINKIYPNNVHAVHDFNLEIKDKEFIVFVGPSGCGKSTTLRMIAGLEDITSGEFYIDGKLMNYVPPKDRDISMVFQNYALYPHMTVYKNMSYSLTIKKHYLPIYEKDPEIDELIKEINVLKKQNASLAKTLIKKDDVDKKEEYLMNFAQIEDLLSRIYEIRKPVMGIDNRRIKRLNKEIKRIDDEIAYVNFLLRKEEQSTDEEKDEEFIEMLYKDLESIEQNKEEKNKILEEISNNESAILVKRKYYSYEIDYEVYKAARLLDISAYLSRFPNELSGGQRQRVALGRSIVRKPKVFLMDEPLSNLDAKLRVQTRSEIARIHQRVGATTIYVTHDQTEAMTLADRIVIMKDGYVQQIDKPMEVFENPSNMFVAGFIGSPSMNFIVGEIKEDYFVIKSEDKKAETKIKLNKEDLKTLKDYINKEVVLGIRPEHISLSKNNDGELNININSIELLGSEFILFGNLYNQSVNVKISEAISPSIRGILNFTINKEKLYFFDKETSERIKHHE